MSNNNNKSSSKKYKQGKIDINFDDSALMVNYEVETVSPCIINNNIYVISYFLLYVGYL